MITIVASSDLWPTPELASKVLDLMLGDDSFAIRVNTEGVPASSIEEMVAKIGKRLGRSVQPYPPGVGRSGTFARDNAMTQASSQVHAFFIDERVMQGGTAHVVSAALNRGIPVTAYKLDREGHVVEVADDEGGVVWT